MIGAILFSGLLLFMGGLHQSRGDYPPEEVKEYLAQLHDVCVKKLGLPDDISKNYDFSHKSPEIMCYMKCIMVEGGWAGEDEVVPYDHLIEVAHPEIKPFLVEMLKNCRDTPSGTQQCEKTYNFFACLHDADPEHFFMP